MNSFAIRTATGADIPTIVTHRRAMFEEMGYSDKNALDVMDTKFKPWVTRKMAGAEYRHWFATNAAGAIAAGAGVWVMEWAALPFDQSERRGNLMNVYTERDFRRLGLAKRLTSTILEWCRENKIETVTLQASDAGRAMYESLGFRATNEMMLQLVSGKELR